MIERTSGRPTDTGIEHARHSFSLLSGLPTDLLERLEKKHGLAEGYVNKIRQVAQFVIPDILSGAPPPQFDPSSEKYKDIEAFLNNELVLQRILSLMTISLIRQNKVGPTLDELQEWLTTKHGESGKERFTLIELRNKLASSITSAGLTGKELSELDTRAPVTEEERERGVMRPLNLHNIINEKVMKKMGAPEDVNKSLRNIFEIFANAETIAFLRNEMVRLIDDPTQGIKKVVAESSLEPYQKAYINDYLVPQIIPPATLSREAKERKLQITKARNMAWALMTHGIVDIGIDEKENVREPSIRVALDPAIRQRIIDQATIFFSDLDQHRRGNTAVPAYMRSLVSGQSVKIQNLWSSLRNRIPRNHFIPRTISDVQKLIKKDLRSMDKSETDAGGYDWQNITVQDFLSTPFGSSLETKIKELKAEIESVQKDKSVIPADEFSRMRAEYDDLNTAADRLAIYRIRDRELAAAEARITDIQKTIDVASLHKDAASRQQLQKEVGDLRGLLARISAQSEDTARRSGGKGRAQTKRIFHLLAQAYMGLSERRGNIQDLIDAGQTLLNQVPSRNARIRQQANTLRHSVAQERQRQRERNPFVTQLTTGDKLFLPYPRKPDERTMEQSSRISFYKSLLEEVFAKIRQLRGPRGRRIAAQDPENVEAVQQYIDTYIRQPIIAADTNLFINPDESDRNRLMDLQTAIRKDIDDLVEQLKQRMQ